MTAAEYAAFCERVALNMMPCKHGHLHCSDEEGGKCSDEEFANVTPTPRPESDS